MSYIEAAKDWVDGDIDANDVAAVQKLVDAGDEAALKVFFAYSTKFGTAGLRELVGPGPGRINRAVIRRTTRAVGEYLAPRGQGASELCVVVGYDARIHSRQFAEETVGVLVALGFRVRYFEDPVPTPLVAYALRAYSAAAAVVVTASHNKKEYNGYKLYAKNGAQIVSPADETIAQLIKSGPKAKDVPFSPGTLSGGHASARPVEGAVIDRYFADIAALRPSDSPKRDLGMVYTPLHGVGYASVRRAFTEAGFTQLSVVEQQAQPNGKFPKLSDPNPEKPRTLQRARETADALGVDLILANDPDADRLAVAVRGPGDAFVQLTGNQIGVLLADYLLERRQRENGDSAARPLIVFSIVSTPMARKVAEAYGARAEVTLTGFKWVWNAAIDLMASDDLEYVFGFEEALGYCAGDIVHDKDGVSAALLFAELAAEEASRGRTVLERLETLYRRHDLWVSQQLSAEDKEPGGVERIKAAVVALAETPPSEVAGIRVDSVVDYRTGGESRPRWLENNEMVQWNLTTGTRVLVRPSGTEPKLKIYVDLRLPLSDGDDLARAEAEAEAQAEAIAQATRQLAGL